MRASAVEDLFEAADLLDEVARGLDHTSFSDWDLGEAAELCCGIFCATLQLVRRFRVKAEMRGIDIEEFLPPNDGGGRGARPS